MVVLDGAPLDRTVTGALWAAFAGGGRHRAAVGRLVVGAVGGRAAARGAGGRRRAAAARRPAPRRHRDRPAALAPRRASASRSSSPRPSTDGRGAAVRRPARASRTWPARSTPPRCCAACRPGARILREPVPGPVLAVVEAATEDEAIALAKRAPGGLRCGRATAPAASAWPASSRPRSRGSTSTATRSPTPPCGSPATSTSRRLASQPTRLRSARWLPYDPQLVRAATASARLMHGRENERLGVLRTGAVPLARTAARLARGAGASPRQLRRR